MTLSPDGTTLYVAVAGMCDQNKYRGQVYRIVVSAPSGSGALTKTPEVTHIFSPAGTGPVLGAGVWGSGGVVLHGGALFTAAGNTINSANEWDALGEHVIKLNPATMQLLGSWSPEGLVNDIGDGDIGATPTVFTPAASSGCTSVLVAAQHKAGVLFLLKASGMSLIARYQLSLPASNGEFITAATYPNTAHNLLYVTAPPPPRMYPTTQGLVAWPPFATACSPWRSTTSAS